MTRVEKYFIELHLLHCSYCLPIASLSLSLSLLIFSLSLSLISLPLRLAFFLSFFLSSLQVRLRVGLFSDVTRDGMVNDDDEIVWMREQYPLADWVYRAGLVVKLDRCVCNDLNTALPCPMLAHD